MPIKDYSTGVAASRTVGQIQDILAKAGAAQILAEYDKGRVIGLSFTVDTPAGPQVFTLPAHPERVRAVLLRQKVQPRFTTEEHAEAVAWRIIKDWVEAQLAIIQTEMVTLDQVMLPYMRTANGTTIYQRYLEHGPTLLEASGRD
jgi:hypothetical protein